MLLEALTVPLELVIYLCFEPLGRILDTLRLTLYVLRTCLM